MLGRKKAGKKTIRGRQPVAFCQEPDVRPEQLGALCEAPDVQTGPDNPQPEAVTRELTEAKAVTRQLAKKVMAPQSPRQPQRHRSRDIQCDRQQKVTAGRGIWL